VEVVLKKTTEALAHKLLTELRGSLPDGLSVLPMNAAVVNVRELYAPLYEFFMRLRGDGVKLMSLNSVAQNIDTESLARCDVVFLKTFGMSNEVAAQSVE
jgi:hypothetical protein